MEEKEQLTADEAKTMLEASTSLTKIQIHKIVGEEKFVNKSLVDRMIELKPKVEETSNVVAFPKVKVEGAPPTSPEELSEKITEYKTSFAEEISEVLWNLVLGELARAGCDFESNIEVYYPSMIMILESIKSLHLQTAGIYHPLQDAAAESFVVTVEEESDEIE